MTDGTSDGKGNGPGFDAWALSTSDFANLYDQMLDSAGNDAEIVNQALERCLRSHPNAAPPQAYLCSVARDMVRESRRHRRQPHALLSEAMGYGGDDSQMVALLDAKGAPDTGHEEAEAAFQRERAGLPHAFEEFAFNFVATAMRHSEDPVIEAIARLVDRAQHALRAGDRRMLERMSDAGGDATARAVPKGKADRINWVLHSNHRHLEPDDAAESALSTVAYFYPSLPGAKEFDRARVACATDVPSCVEPSEASERELRRLGESAPFGLCQNLRVASPGRSAIEGNARYRLRQWAAENPEPSDPPDAHTWRERYSLAAATVALTELSDAATANKILAPDRVKRSRDEKKEHADRERLIAALALTLDLPGDDGEVTSK